MALGGSSDSASSSASASPIFGSQGLSEGVIGLIAIGLVVLVIGILAFRKN